MQWAEPTVKFQKTNFTRYTAKILRAKYNHVCKTEDRGTEDRSMEFFERCYGILVQF